MVPQLSGGVLIPCHHNNLLMNVCFHGYLLREREQRVIRVLVNVYFGCTVRLRKQDLSRNSCPSTHREWQASVLGNPDWYSLCWIHELAFRLIFFSGSWQEKEEYRGPRFHLSTNCVQKDADIKNILTRREMEYFS